MATHAYDWQRLASPAGSSHSGSGSHRGSNTGAGAGSQRAYADPYPYAPGAGAGLYPGAPHLGTIDLPETDSPMVGYGYMSPGPGYGSVSSGSGSGSASSRPRPMSVPPEMTGLGIYTHGLPSPPISPHNSMHMNGNTTGSGSAPEVHPLLRGNSNTLIVYNILRTPETHGHYALRTIQEMRVRDSDLAQPATNPICPRLRVTVILYPGGISSPPSSTTNPPRRFFWHVDLIPSRRSSAPPSAPSPLALGDALYSLHRSLNQEISEVELHQLPPQEIHNARAVFAARRSAFPNSPANYIRADFAHGCTYFAGFVRNADNTFSVRLMPHSPAAI